MRFSSVRRFANALVVLPFLLVFFACEQDPMSLDTPAVSYAKGGKGGKGGDTTPVVQSFWVKSQEDGASLIHIAGSGSVASVGFGTAHDFFFNGQRDDDAPLDTHFEWGDAGKATVEVAPADSESWHFDLTWNGERRTGRDENLEPIYEPYPDFLTTSVDGTGADPFALRFPLRNEDRDRLLGHKPVGVMSGGHLLLPEEVLLDDAHHGLVGPVTSYAVRQSASPTGTISVAEFAGTNVGCSVVSTRSGRGKDKTTTTVRRINFDFTLSITGAEVVPVVPGSRYWFEVHVLDVATGILSNNRVGTTEQDNISGHMWVDLPGDGSLEPELQVVLDFLRPIGALQDYSYDAEGNDKVRAVTTVGLTTDLWTNAAASSTLYDDGFPMVRSQSVFVTCN